MIQALHAILRQLNSVSAAVNCCVYFSCITFVR